MTRVAGTVARAIAVAALLTCVLLAACDRAPPRKIVIIGGADSEGPGRHDYPDGVRALQSLLETSPGARGKVVVAAYPDGWPRDPKALDDAAAVVWYFDGLDKHPLRDPARRAAFEAAMRRGVGLVALHQASTVPSYASSHSRISRPREKPTRMVESAE